MPLQAQKSRRNRAEYERLIDVFRAHNIGYFLYNGGGDSADTCLKVSQISAQMGYPIQAIHVPKTIDNDLPLTDNCPGFGSVAKYVAISTKEAALDIESMCATSTKVFIGSHGAACRMDCRCQCTGFHTARRRPHVILFPEIAFDQQRFLDKVAQSVDRYGYCVVVASEGASTATVVYCLIRASGMPSDTRNWAAWHPS